MVWKWGIYPPTTKFSHINILMFTSVLYYIYNNIHKMMITATDFGMSCFESNPHLKISSTMLWMPRVGPMEWWWDVIGVELSLAFLRTSGIKNRDRQGVLIFRECPLIMDHINPWVKCHILFFNLQFSVVAGCCWSRFCVLETFRKNQHCWCLTSRLLLGG